MPAPLDRFVARLGDVIDEPEAHLVLTASALLGELVADAGWLADDLATPDPDRSPQYLRHRDAVRRRTYHPDGTATPFVSGYSNHVPVAGAFAAT